MESLGAKLRREREKKNLSLEQASSVTKIGTRFLTAIETDQFDQLPGGIFNRGFIRSYARYLGLDEETIIDQYIAAAGGNDPNMPVQPQVSQEVWPEERSESRAPWMALAVAVLIIAAGAVAWKVRYDTMGSSSSTTSIGSAEKAPEQPKPAVATTEPDARPQQLQQNLAPLPASADRAKTVPGEPFHVQIVAREQSWIFVSGPQGEILRQVISPPQRKNFTLRGSLTVKAGNVGGLDFFWNHRALPPQGKQGEVKTLIFDSEGVHAASSAQAATTPPG